MTAGIFALAGVLLGVLLEPARARFASRARNRQERIERCGRLVEAATTVLRLGASLNDVSRKTQRQGGRAPKEEQVHSIITDYNLGYDRTGVTVALIRLSGPDELEEAADAVLRAIDAHHAKLQEPDDEVSRADPTALPDSLGRAREEARAAIEEFSRTARRFTR